ncbi:hypothetical protein GCM10027594_22130 [Hymenobacter agri]
MEALRAHQLLRVQGAVGLAELGVALAWNLAEAVVISHIVGWWDWSSEGKNERWQMPEPTRHPEQSEGLYHVCACLITGKSFIGDKVLRSAPDDRREL